MKMSKTTQTINNNNSIIKNDNTKALKLGNSKLIAIHIKTKKVVKIINNKEILSQQNAILLLYISNTLNILNDDDKALPPTTKTLKCTLYNTNEIKNNFNEKTNDNCLIKKRCFSGIINIKIMAKIFTKINKKKKKKSLKNNKFPLTKIVVIFINLDL